MRWLPLPFVETVLRGYGQMFLANRVVSGMLFLFGLLVLSPANACWSLLGACAVMALASLAGASAEADSGLFGVNGALLGFSWILFPEVPVVAKFALTLLGSALIVLVLIPSVWLLRRQRSGITLFALPYILAIWVNLLVASELGLYDCHFWRGWCALHANNPNEAAEEFLAIEIGPPTAIAFKEDGLGWAEYRRANFDLAKDHFVAAIGAKPDLWDALDGAGWCCLRLHQMNAARGFFEPAVQGNPLLATSWDGLGWVARASGDADEAQRCFSRAILAAPFFADAHRGFAHASSGVPIQQSGSIGKEAEADVAGLIERNVGSRFQLITSGQLLCWLLAIAGIMCHSRFSALVVGIGVVACGSAAYALPQLNRCISDIAFLYNLFPLLLALGGQYVRLTPAAIGWTIAAAILLALSWTPLSASLTSIGLPILCLPFNLLLVMSLIGLRYFRWGRAAVVPLEVAVTSPEEVRAWHQRVNLAKHCWERLGHGHVIPPRTLYSWPKE